MNELRVLLCAVLLTATVLAIPRLDQHVPGQPWKRGEHPLDGPQRRGDPLPSSDSAPWLTSIPYHHVRLPTSVLPDHYDLAMDTDLMSFTFSGYVKIHATVYEDTDFVVFHSKSLAITNGPAVTVNGKDAIVDDVIVSDKDQMIYIKFGEHLLVGDKLVIHIEFEGQLENNLKGYYRSHYIDGKHKKKWIAVTQFEATDARRAFPCFDEPSLKASFSFSMVRDHAHHTLFNTPLEDSTPLTDGRYVDRFSTTPKMSTYLVAFVVSDYAKLTAKTRSGIELAVHAPSNLIEYGAYALEVAAKILDYYEIYFGIKFPLPKMDMVSVRDFAAGAMENWGIVTFNQPDLLFDPDYNSLDTKQRVTVVVAHEFAHQWFGNLVTMKWWNDIWLNEGFASFVEYIGTDIVNKSWKMPEQFITSALREALGADSVTYSHPIQVDVNNPDEIGKLFDTISYAKGASIIRMIGSFMGKRNMMTGLKTYLHKYQFSNADTNDLWSALSTAAEGVDVKSVMNTWTNQMGFPLVTIKMDEGRVTATQERYLKDSRRPTKSPYKSPYGYKWHVPLTYTTDRNNDTLVWMPMTNITFEVSKCSKWIKANLNDQGFYRVQYTSSNWQALSDQLVEDHLIFSTADRANLLSDIHALSRTKHVSISSAMDLTRYLREENEYIPWSLALRDLAFIDDRLVFGAGAELFKKYMLNLIGKQMDDFSFDKDYSRLQTSKYVTLLAYGLQLRHKGLERKAVAEWQAYRSGGADGAKVVPVDYMYVVFSSGVKYGAPADWDYAWSRYSEGGVSGWEKWALLCAMGVTGDQAKLQQYLEYSIDINKSGEDGWDMLMNTVEGSVSGNLAAWKFTKENWSYIYKRYGDESYEMYNLIFKMVKSFSTPELLEDVKTFFSTHPAGQGKSAVQNGLHYIQWNIDWKHAHEEEITQWLIGHEFDY